MQEIYRNSVHHLDAVHYYSPGFKFKFDFDGYETYFCTTKIPQSLVPTVSALLPTAPAPVTDYITLFEVMGRLSETKTRTIEGPDSRGRTSFWVECNSDSIWRAMWEQIPLSLGAISKATGISFRFSRLFEIDADTGVLRLRIKTPADGNVSYCATPSKITKITYTIDVNLDQ